VDVMLEFLLKNRQASNLKKLTLTKVEELKLLEIEFSEKIGEFGLEIIEKIYQKKQQPVNILTHCNAGWLACIDWGTATAPIYKAHRKGIPVHVWVDETRPRNQGARLTAFELGQEAVPHTVIADNTGGHLMQHKMVDLVIVGSDRTTVTGDVANKIGTYLKALAAKDNGIPFYVALPSSTFDWQMEDGIAEIPIEKRDADEVTQIEGWYKNSIQQVRLIPENSRAVNYGFDVTPARLVTGLITERGISKANRESITALFPERGNNIVQRANNK
jgi:methylthioribose-1-phosphate isomerase